MILLTGGTWGPDGLDRLEHGALADLTKDDFLIILGDCGAMAPRVDREAVVRCYRALPCSVLYLDGSRDDYDTLSDYPPFRWNGGLIQVISRGILHLMRGQVFRLDGKTFFVAGGAATLDRSESDKYWDWWPEQDPGPADWEAAETALNACDRQVDYVLSCDCPVRWRAEVAVCDPTAAESPSEASRWLDGLEPTINYRHWFFGNYAADTEVAGGRAQCVCRQVVRL
ncbi:MAG: hypothetical protein WCQ63_00315 [Methanomethylophilus sp.]|nr:hypothetical protein [Methanomethylophilus sp.]MDD4669310.1 hypothetical protein [Methanomethylophilus sp.]